MGEAFTAATKYVLTRGDQPLPWANSHRMGGMDDVVMLKQGDGPDLLIQGSSTIYPALLAAGLLDRLVLYTFPIILGSGKRLFGDGTPSGTLKLVDHQVSPGGTVITPYEPRRGDLACALRRQMTVEITPALELGTKLNRFNPKFAHRTYLQIKEKPNASIALHQHSQASS